MLQPDLLDPSAAIGRPGHEQHLLSVPWLGAPLAGAGVRQLPGAGLVS